MTSADRMMTAGSMESDGQLGARATTVVVQPDERHPGGGIKEERHFTAEERRGRNDADESGERGTSGTGDEDEHEDLEGGFHCRVFHGCLLYCTRRARSVSYTHL